MLKVVYDKLIDISSGVPIQNDDSTLLSIIALFTEMVYFQCVIPENTLQCQLCISIFSVTWLSSSKFSGPR